ncbi:MAG: hypothetical protein K2P88_05760 [Chitinophagaceae bacterium]|uniref:hypothetical protein n=1 Tax=unclassified Paraflavitalea TaxID=2798305 RepID=UPI003D336E78|nr:hypothetical protein [Chitinophagaceae bacterium]
MISFLSQLKQRNKLFFYYGLFSFIGCFIMMMLYQQQPFIVAGANAWAKPFKFFLSIAVLCWTMGWLLHELNEPKKVRMYTIMSVVMMTIELVIITWQAANGRLSHFNQSTPLYGALYALMGVAILTFTCWTAYITFLFFKLKSDTITPNYLLSIQLGLLFFVIFSFEGGVMSAFNKHTIGGNDGSPGIPLLGWSYYLGDLRVAHFFGIHSLQVLPLMGAYFTTSKKQVWLFGILYFILVSMMLLQAFLKVPFIEKAL